jgi:hypothetical protein
MPSGTTNDRWCLVSPKLLELCGAEAVDVLFSEVFHADLRCLCLSRLELDHQLWLDVIGANLHRRRLLRPRPKPISGHRRWRLGTRIRTITIRLSCPARDYRVWRRKNICFCGSENAAQDRFDVESSDPEADCCTIFLRRRGSARKQSHSDSRHNRDTEDFTHSRSSRHSFEPGRKLSRMGYQKVSDRKLPSASGLSEAACATSAFVRSRRYAYQRPGLRCARSEHPAMRQAN